VFPILVAIIFAMIDVGRFIATRTMLAQAAAAAARTACLSSSTSVTDVQTAASDAAPSLTGMTTSMICGGACTFPVASKTVVRITVNYSFAATFYSAFTRSMTNYSLVTCV
jgi:Flp pilus assembly protein TadG